MPCSRSFPVHPINTMEVDANTNSFDTVMKAVAMDFLTKKAYAPPSWASHIKSIPPHTFSLGQFPTPIHKWNLPNLPPNTEVWLKVELLGNLVMVLKSTIPGSVEVRKNDLCISILKSYEIKNVPLKKTRSSPEVLGNDISLGGDIQPCKRCGRSESISNMLICDRCEEAFHVKCCKSRVVFPIDDWFCGSCSKIMCEKSQNDSFLKSPSSMGLRFGSTCKFELGSIAVMLKYREPFTSKVWIGEAYQAEVPDWCDQIPKYVNCFLFCSSVVVASMSIISTPLSGVETDDRDCSVAVVLDPSPSDCAGPPPQMASENGIASRKRKLEMVESPEIKSQVSMHTYVRRTFFFVHT